MRAVMKKFVAARFCVLSSEMEARKREEKTVKSQINGKNAGPNRCEKLQMPSCIWSLLSRKDNEAAFNGRKRRRLGHPKPAGRDVCFLGFWRSLRQKKTCRKSAIFSITGRRLVV
jgi:hypothetical protein